MNGWIELLIGIVIGVAAASVPWFIIARTRYQTGRRDGAGESAQTQTDLKVTQSENSQLRERLAQSEQALETKRTEVAQLGAGQAELRERLQQQQQQSEEKLKLVEQARVNLSDAFKALSSEALKSNNEEFLKINLPACRRGLLILESKARSPRFQHPMQNRQQSQTALL